MANSPTWITVVAVALEGEGGRWLMHRRPAAKHHGGLWEFPGGKVERGEDPRSALVREIREELGITLDRGALEPSVFADGAASAEGQEIVILLYTCRDWSGEPRALEGEAIGWFTPHEITELALPPLDRALVARLFARAPG